MSTGNGVTTDPFDVSTLRLGQDFAASIGVRKELTTVPVRRPDRQWFIQVHPDPAMRLETAVLETTEDRETYLVAPNLRMELAGEIVAKILLTTITKQGHLFLWPIRLPDALGKLDQWNQSAMAAAQLAEKQWVRVAANRTLGAYETYVATGDLPPPEWSQKTLPELLRLAFKERYIDTMEHVIVRQLRGQV